MRLNVISLLLIIFLASACRKGERITTDPNAKLDIPNNKVLFDTIFTSVGSITKRIKIVNQNNDAIKVSEIRLAGGSTSAFSINVNGEGTTNKNDLIINGKDSINLFIKVSNNPNSENLAFLVQDSVLLNTNGNRQVIQLMAYGQNAIFINESAISTNTTWTKSLPYIINGSLTVKNGASLNVQPGVKVYFHKDATLNIEGSLFINGSITEPVLFCSDRLERVYNNEPGQWKVLK